jgi:hypothetical protein
MLNCTMQFKNAFAQTKEQVHDHGGGAIFTCGLVIKERHFFCDPPPPKHRALWVRARAVRPPGNDATTWHAAENAEHLKGLSIRRQGRL